jgi:hypothetical protein
MRDPGSVFANLNGGPFPTWTGKNATGAGNTDGTEYIASMIDDYMFGWVQRAMAMASMSPDGVAESYTASQIIEALQLILSPPGTICEWNLSVDPATIGARFLFLNGQGILRANYPELDANVYVGDGLNATAGRYYRADNANGTGRNTAGIYLILPESRGYSVRGIDTAASVDPDGAIRDLGHLQSHAFQGHRHPPLTGTKNVELTGGTAWGGSGGTFSLTDSTGNPITGSHGAVSISTETRMANRATKFVIRY